MKEIRLSGGSIAIVDCEDFDRVSKHSWYLETNGYARSRIGGQRVSMHRFIMGLEVGVKVDVDHVNGQRQDNRKVNLRLCTRAQNLANQGLKPSNTSGFKGVSWDKSKGKWQAKITHHGKQIHLGRFSNPEDAYAAYCKAAREKNGTFASYGERASHQLTRAASGY